MTDTTQGRRPTFREVAECALGAVERVLAHWLPEGQRKGHEYLARNPRRADGKPGSFSVNTVKGAWADFATGDKGGDLVALVAYLDGVKQGEAAARLADFLGMQQTAPPQARITAPRRSKPGTMPVLPVPADAPTPPRAHPKHGKPACTWTYRNTDGAVLFHVARFDTTDGKEILPLSLWREHGALCWHWRGIPEPRPLYGLDRLAARPDAPVIVCEGEKDADAAGALLPEYVAITSPNGSRSAGKAEWSPLRARRIFVWPDADEPGTAYARDVAKWARKAGAASVAMVRMDELGKLHGEALPAGWGAADALAEGLNRDSLARIISDSTSFNTAPEYKTKIKPTAFMLVFDGESRELRPGVYYIPTLRDKRTGELVEGMPEWLCSPLEVEAITRDTAGAEWGRLLRFPDLDGVVHRWAMPYAMLAKDGVELRENLMSLGLDITADPVRRRRLGEYIQTAAPERFARCTTRTGWHGDAFVLPDRTIGPVDGETLVFQSVAASGNKLGIVGTLETWRDAVSVPCVGNPRLILSLSAAFAAPCLRVVGLEGGGLHLRGPSSCGKSTALAVAASVYGPPDYRREWRATDNALEAVAAMHSDTLLPLDEIGQLQPQHAAAVAYLLANGQGKSRSRRDGSLRAPATWRVLFLSCGEVGLADLISEAGGRARAGMDVRVVDLPAVDSDSLGMFECLPDRTAPGAFADALRHAAAANYGTAFPVFLSKLVAEGERARRVLRHTTDALAMELIGTDAAGQVRRVAQRFALIGAGGEIATQYGVTGWPKGEALKAARACFTAWLAARGGAGEAEPRAMLRQVQAFIGQHSEGRFTPMDRADDDRAPKTLLRAGWRVVNDEGALEHWVLPETWRKEVCKGFDPAEVARVLAARELLKPESGGHGYTRRERVKGEHGFMVRVYRLLPGLLDCEP